MARLSIVGFAAALTAPLMAAAGAGTILAIDNPTDAARLGEVLNGDSTRGCTQEAVNTVVLTLTHPAGMEVIEAQVLAGALTVVARGLEGTMPLNHPIGTCLRFNGNPDSPCDRAADICSSESARKALVDCSYFDLLDRIRGDILIARIITDNVCSSEEIRDILGSCVAHGVGEQLTIDLGFLTKLIEKILENMTWEQVETLAEKLLTILPNKICERSDVRAQLAGCLALNMVEAIRDNPAARTLLQSLITTGMSGVAISASVCGSGEAITQLSQCLAGGILTAIQNNAALTLALRQLALSVDGSTGLTLNSNHTLGFTYHPSLIVQAICASAPQAQAMAACLQPYIVSGAPGSGASGIAVQFGFRCPNDDGAGGNAASIFLYARIQDPSVVLANISNMQVGVGTGAAGTWVFQPFRISTLFDGTKIIEFGSNSAAGSAKAGPLVCTFSANGVTYTGMVSPSCSFADPAGGGGG